MSCVYVILQNENGARNHERTMVLTKTASRGQRVLLPVGGVVPARGNVPAFRIVQVLPGGQPVQIGQPVQMGQAVQMNQLVNQPAQISQPVPMVKQAVTSNITRPVCTVTQQNVFLDSLVQNPSINIGNLDESIGCAIDINNPTCSKDDASNLPNPLCVVSNVSGFPIITTSFPGSTKVSTVPQQVQVKEPTSPFASVLQETALLSRIQTNREGTKKIQIGKCGI